MDFEKKTRARSKSLEIEATERDHVSIEIANDNITLQSSIKEKMESISLSHCIYKVHEQLFRGNENNYFPSLVSIGPFHYGNETHKLMQDKKWRYLNTLLNRKPYSDATLDTCIRALRRMEQKSRNFYGEKIEMASDNFVEMMLIDGCFIIELFLEFAFKSLRRRDDVCFGTNDVIFKLRCDLVLFENQVPFFVLEKLFHLVPIPKECTMSLVELSLFFFRKLIPENHAQFPRKVSSPPQTLHLLDLIRQHFLPTSPQILSSSNTQRNIPHATNLDSLGIRVKRAISESPLNVSFYDGELKIPSLEIHSYTEILFRNLIAMENHYPACSKHVTSYVTLMERLIQSNRDVRFFRNKEIIIDGHEREGEIVFLFQKLHMDLNVKEFYYNGLCEEISGYQSRRIGLCGIIRHVYHRTHLGVAGLSLAMLILVFLFTGVFFSTVYFLLHHFQ
ncbi:hypothetical protein ABFS83_07G006300 [Erythranthe nasuta]